MKVFAQIFGIVAVIAGFYCIAITMTTFESGTPQLADAFATVKSKFQPGMWAAGVTSVVAGAWLAFAASSNGESAG